MRILLTGATGYVGSRLGVDLVQNGHEVLALSRNPKAAKLKMPFPAKVVGLDELNKDMQIDAVIHLAGASVAEKRWSESYKNVLRSSRVDFTKKIMERLNLEAVKVWLQASAIGIYKASDSGIDEDSDQADGFLGDLVRDWEASSQSLSCRKAYLRIGMVVGEESPAIKKMLPLFKKGAGANLGSGKQFMPWVHIADVCNVFLKALEGESFEGVYNMTAPQKLTNAQFTKLFNSSLGSFSFLPPAPSFALKAVYGEMSQILLNSLPVVPKKLLDEGYDFEFSDPKKALEESLKGQSVSQEVMIQRQWLNKGLEESFEFFKNEKNLEILTPGFLNFKVLGKNTKDIESGTLIDYKLKIHGLPVKWRTEIKDWKPPYVFSDTQLKGPYKKWHHTHSFKSLGGGTLMEDRVEYQIPLGALGRLSALWKVKKDVEQIFKYRRKKIAEIFS